VPEETARAARVALEQAPSIARLGVAEEVEAPREAAGLGLRVLVVDDEPINREVLAQHLTAKGFEVSHAQDGAQAIERIEAERPDLVLLDVMMPKKTGYDVLEAVRPKLDAQELPVLLLTAKAQESDLKYGFSQGASDYLLKPVSFVELDARLGHHAKLVRAARALSAELEERRRLQGELDRATHRLTQAEQMATLGMLMAGIAHDLRNPLNYVQNAADELEDALPLLRSEREEDRARAAASVTNVVPWVRQGVTAMDAISRAMRNQSRVGAAELEAVSLRDVVVEALLLCRGRCGSCVVDVEADDVTVRVDPTGLGQLVMNFVSNAADALEEAREAGRAARMAIRVRVRVEGAGRFALEVHDSGPGIPAELRARILEPFFTTKPRGVGTGLGLAIVQRVVRDHRGELAVERSPELGGALFRATFPGTA
jgi:signal transduction histidine kinase